MMIIVVLLLVACCCSFFLVAGGGAGWWFFIKDEDEDEEKTPTAISTQIISSSSSPIPESFDGLYTGYEEVTTITNRGDTECRAYATQYNTANPTTPYVAYSVRNAAHGTGNAAGNYGSGTCLFYKATGLEKAYKTDTSKAVQKLTTKCMDPKNYPNNFCLSTPPPAVAKDPYIGYYSPYDDGAASIVGETACRAHITTQNATAGIGEDDKYVGFGIRDDNHPASARGTCIFYKKKHLVDASRLDASKPDAKVTSKCTNGKSPDNWCS